MKTSVSGEHRIDLHATATRFSIVQVINNINTKLYHFLCGSLVYMQGLRRHF